MDKEEIKKMMLAMGMPQDVIDNVFGVELSVQEKTQKLCDNSSNKLLGK